MFEGKYEGLPWRTILPFQEAFASNPTFAVGQVLFFVLTIAGLVHAVRSSKRHVLLWIAALTAGTANDLFFILLPIVDNFFHTQGLVMITPRLPLYICCLYIVFMYYAAAAARRFQLPWWAEAPLAGLLGELIYAPFDIVGQKYLWWTWHDTDAGVRIRLLGAPIGSTMWVIMFTAVFAALLQLLSPAEGKPMTIAAFFKALVGTSLLATPIFLVQMPVLQLAESQGQPGIAGLAICLGLYLSLVLVGIWKRNKSSGTRALAGEPLTGLLMVAYFLFYLGCVILGDPAAVRQVGIFQTVGPCDVHETDITGHTREVFLCPTHFDEPFSLQCGTSDDIDINKFANMKADTAEDATDVQSWYAICGVPFSFSQFRQYVVAEAALAVTGIVLFLVAFGPKGTSKRSHTKPKRA